MADQPMQPKGKRAKFMCNSQGNPVKFEDIIYDEAYRIKSEFFKSKPHLVTDIYLQPHGEAKGQIELQRQKMVGFIPRKQKVNVVMRWNEQGEPDHGRPPRIMVFWVQYL